MKNKIIIALFGFALSASAVDYPPSMALSVVEKTVGTVSDYGATNYTANLTNEISFAVYHSFFTSFTSTNGGSVAIDRSLDAVSWVAVNTNVFTTTGVGEITMTGRWNYARARGQGTNFTLTVKYLGGR
jgi:hypothetical protein